MSILTIYIPPPTTSITFISLPLEVNENKRAGFTAFDPIGINMAPSGEKRAYNQKCLEMICIGITSEITTTLLLQYIHTYIFKLLSVYVDWAWF